jgi:hypothetical protein
MRIITSVAFLMVCTLVHAQFKEPKFGKISVEELTMSRYEKDTTADAVYLFDNGFSRFNVNTNRQFEFSFERHVRIKIFKKAAFDLAEFEINLQQNGSRYEKINNLKAATYNVVGGKMITSKLDKDNIFEEESKYLIKKKFAFPEVKEGSIIELSYTITSDFLYDFRGWNFQHAYPAVWSQYSVVIPEYFVYRQDSKGYLPFTINTNEQGQATYILHYDVDLTNGRTPAENYEIKAVTHEQTFAIQDVPAFKSEPNIDCEDNYIQSISFELSSVQYPHEIRKDYTKTWESVNKMMWDSEDFGKLLGSNGFIEDTVAKICNGLTTKIDKATAIYSYVQNRMKWNGKFNIFTDNGLKKAYKERSGSSIEINMLLTLMLQTAGLHADPVLMSTRKNGVAISFFPTISKFNTVISRVEIEGIDYLLDATSDFCPFGVLPYRDLNGKGRLVNSTVGGWVDLDPKVKHITTKVATLNITPEGELKGIFQDKYNGYAAVEYRDRLASVKSEEDYVQKIQEHISGLTINEYKFSDKLNIYKPLTDSLSVNITDKVDVLGDKLLFKPLLLETEDKNIYTLKERSYPVNYAYPTSESFIFEYAIPEGYAVESVPASANMKLPDGSVNMIYNITQDNNKIRLIYKCNINKSIFLPEEYPALKEFYDLIVKKHSEQVILKKI